MKSQNFIKQHKTNKKGMSEESKRHLKFFVGVLGMVPLMATIAIVSAPELNVEVSHGVKLFLIIFLIFSYCFGLMKWIFPNG